MTKGKYNIMKINKIDSEKTLSKFCQIFCRAKFLTETCFAILTEMIINKLSRFLRFFEKISVKTKFAFLHILTEYKKLVINKLDRKKAKKHSVKIFSNSDAQVVLSGKIREIFQKSEKFFAEKIALFGGKMSFPSENNFKIFAR